MVINSKAAAIGSVLVATYKIDRIKSNKSKIQAILGEDVYFHKGSKWYYNVELLNKKTVKKLQSLSKQLYSLHK